MQAPRRYPRQEDKSPVTHQLLALENQTDLDSSLLPHLMRFIACFVTSLSRFRLTESLTVGLAIGGALSMAGKVVVGLSR